MKTGKRKQRQAFLPPQHPGNLRTRDAKKSDAASMLCFLIVDNTGRAHRAPVIHIGNNDSRPGIAGMHHLAVSDVHRHMVDASAASIENQIARLHLADADLRAAVRLGCFALCGNCVGYADGSGDGRTR